MRYCTRTSLTVILGVFLTMNLLSRMDPVGRFRFSLQTCLCFVALFAIGIALQISGGFTNLQGLIWLVLAISICATALVCPRLALELPSVDRALIRRAFLCVLLVYFALNLLVLRFHHHGPIDVILWENDSARTLLHGGDPYGSAVTHVDVNPPERHFYPGIAFNGVVHVGFTYPPLVLLSVIPGYIAGDVRYSFLFVVGLSAVIMFYIAPNLNGLAAAILFLFLPKTTYVLTYGFTDPLIVVTLALTIACALRSPRWLPIALGLFFSSKQFTVVAVPLAALLLPEFSWKKYLLLLMQAGAVIGVLLLPFLLWDPSGLWFDLAGFHLAVPMRADALTFSAILVSHGFRSVPGWFAVLAITCAAGFALKYAPRTPAGFAISVALVSLVTFVFSKQAFCGYYFYCAGALCLGLATAEFDLAPSTIFGLVKVSSSEAFPAKVGSV